MNYLTNSKKETTDKLYSVSIEGTRPLLQNDSFGKEETSAKTKKIYDPKHEANLGLIKNEEGIVCQKSLHIEKAMAKAAVQYKLKGQKTYKDAFVSNISVEPFLIPHSNPKWVIDEQPVKIGPARVLKWRPRLDKWALDFIIRNRDPENIAPQIILEILVTAGHEQGIGDYRPKYGLFEVTKFEDFVENTEEQKPIIKRRKAA